MVKLGAHGIENENDISGDVKPLPGRYHVLVKSVDESFEKFDKVIVEFEVLAGTVPGQESRTLTEFYSVSERALQRLQRLALVVGLLKPGEEEREVEFSDAEGRSLVIEVEENKYTNKDGKNIDSVRVSFLGMWSVGNEEVADVPKNDDALALQASGGGGQVGSSAAAGNDAYADL